MTFRPFRRNILLTLAIAPFLLRSSPAQDLDATPHTVQSVTVEPNVQLEVLDWGGSGRPLVLLTGLGTTAHYFDQFAIKLSASYHVYGITRRGFGKSSAPPPVGDAYSADRLGDDVLIVLDALKLRQPVLVGHSIGGEELSSIGSRHPERVSGLVYLDAAMGYAYYSSPPGWLDIDVRDIETKLELLRPGKGPNDTTPVLRELLQSLPRFQKVLEVELAWQEALPPSMREGSSASMPAVSQAILAGTRKYTRIPVPTLAIFAVPHDMGPAIDNDATVRAKFDVQDKAWMDSLISAFEKGVPQARVVRLPHAKHFVFQSNEADVLREMDGFIKTLR